MKIFYLSVNLSVPKNKSLNFKELQALLWYHSESNQGHTDFQSVALPTELWYQFNSEIDGAKVITFI